MPDVPERPAILDDAPAFRSAILAWYDARGRSLPFRGTTDPYAVLVSETMAQQTQIGRVGPAWRSFLARFPSFETLAAASPADVLREWRGLGYNRRALNLQRTARCVVEAHAGRLPRDVAELERLPGIGPYTARAVAAIAFEAPVGAVDTNVRRVLGRVLAGDPAGLPAARLQSLADELVAPARAADWTHALMDVGATHCRSATPRCDGCPAAPWCRYRADVGEADGSPGAATAGPGRRAAGGSPARANAGSAGPATGGSASPAMGGSTGRATGFERSTRWLRGRIVDRARAAEGDGWTAFGESMGTHGPEDVLEMLRVLAGEGLVELHPADPALARLPVAPGAGPTS